jgi:hypothetical protein
MTARGRRIVEPSLGRTSSRASVPVEFRGKHLPRNELAHQLQFADREHDELGERLLSALIGAAAVDEVYADGPELARLARATRPRD